MCFALAQNAAWGSSALPDHIFNELRRKLSFWIFRLLFNLLVGFVLKLNLHWLLGLVIDVLGRNHLVRRRRRGKPYHVLLLIAGS